MTVLLLGGTAEARALAERLIGCDVSVLSSLAGRVARPRLPVGPVRIGGFGGVDGPRDWLVEHEASAVVDATHPFAERISTPPATACRSRGGLCYACNARAGRTCLRRRAGTGSRITTRPRSLPHDSASDRS